MRELNLEFQLGETWAVDFVGESLEAAELAFRLVQGLEVIDLAGADSPTAFTIDSPAVAGSVTLEGALQDVLIPGFCDYEIRSSDATIAVLQFGKIAIGASLFEWSNNSPI